MMAPTSRTLVFGTLLRLSSAVLVAQDSPCSVNCGNVLSATPSDDIVCSKSDYDGTAGTIFKNCVECEARSTYTTEAEDPPASSDLQAMLCTFIPRRPALNWIVHVRSMHIRNSLTCDVSPPL